jgi:hypothetical protein
MTRTVLFAVVLCATGCSEYDFVSAPAPVAGELPTDWTDPSSVPESTPESEPTPGEPSGGQVVALRPPGHGEVERDPGTADDPDPGSEDVGDPGCAGDVPNVEEVPGADEDTGADDDGAEDLDPDSNGCTPGFWKQEQHVGSWPAPLAAETPFVDAFGVDAFPGLTLLDVLELGEADLDALGRHAVAALLSALSDDVDYPLTDEEVIEAFEVAYDSGVYEDTKDVFAAYNEDHCPL